MPDDVLAEIDNKARRHKLEEQALQALSQARFKLILGDKPENVFFATLALRLQCYVAWDIPTAAVDGKHFYYNPAWWSSLSLEHRIGVLVHEIMHIILQHISRRGGREPGRYNVAADLAINPLVVDAGFRLPEDALFPGQGSFVHLASGLLAEEYYRLVADLDLDDILGGPDPGRCGGVRDTLSGQLAQKEWQIAVAQARDLAKRRGNLPGGLGLVIDELLQPQVDWRTVLREFVTATIKNNYSWCPPNRRYIWQNLYLPALTAQPYLDRLITAMDTSGSTCSKEILTAFASEKQSIVTTYNCDLTVLYHDTKIQHIDYYKSSDGKLVLHPRGGGGTSHKCVFEHISKLAEPPLCLICFTDLYTEFPDTSPPYPVLWVVTGDNKALPPFGKVIYLR